MTPGEIERVEQALSASPLKRYVEYHVEKTAFDRAMSNAAKTLEEVHFERGVQEGLNIAKGILNRTKK